MAISLNFRYWPIATNFSLGPDVSFRSEAEVDGWQSSLPRSKMTQLGSGVCIAAIQTMMVFARGEDGSKGSLPRPVEKCPASPLIIHRRSSLVHSGSYAVL